ncbi:MAG: hypothetical protein H6626_10425 [Pseudobdellovibrionaceae bacterium]|nr:hypothetical protein [Bdellovibrionales bacterium]USN46624.1 MAG: hypothetical protein H6626_10425 [Pseudobdellovibrionaceae bacterium]
MKWLTLTVLMFAAQIALASPNIGDQATYTGNAITNTGVVGMTLSKEILNYDHRTNTYLVKTDYHDDRGTFVTETEVVARRDLISAADGAALMERCGDSEKQVKSSPAGEFETCKIQKSEEGFTVHEWISAVPFGLVYRTESIDEITYVDWRLLSFKIGEGIH